MIVLLGYVTMVDSLDYESDWKCCLCSQKIETTQVKELIEKMEDEVANLQVSINGKKILKFLILYNFVKFSSFAILL